MKTWDEKLEAAIQWWNTVGGKSLQVMTDDAVIKALNRSIKEQE